MSRVRDLPETTTLDNADLFYVVDFSEGPNGGKKITKANVKTAVMPTASEVKTLYESNLDTNAYTDAEKTKLAGIETGATADQNAAEVPYNNSTSGLTAIQVQDAIDELAANAINDFTFTVMSGRMVTYTGGIIHFYGNVYTISAGSLVLNASVAGGHLYIDFDGTIKQTGSSTEAPAGTIPLYEFTTDLNSVLSLVDHRQEVVPFITIGASGDITAVAPDNVATAGSTNKFADAGHIHTIPSGTAIGLSASTSNATGTANSVSRSDHTHAISTGTPSTQNADQSNAAGTSANLARADHIHNIPTATPVATGTENAQGAANTFAKSDHVHKTEISNSSATATTTQNTTSLTDVLIPNMTLTPAAGTYLAIFSTSTVNSGNGSARNYFSIYSGGGQVSHSERRVGISGGSIVPVSTHAVVTVNGSQAIEAQWRVVGGTGTVYNRSLTLVKLS